MTTQAASQGTNWFQEAFIAVVDGYRDIEVAKIDASRVPPVPDPDRDPNATGTNASTSRVMGIDSNVLLIGSLGLLAVALLLKS